jgi:hypothetical protein
MLIERWLQARALQRAARPFAFDRRGQFQEPLEVRNALLYVVRNAAKHAAVKVGERDYYSSAPYFDGFTTRKAKTPPKGLLAHATAWLLTTGWLRE